MVNPLSLIYPKLCVVCGCGGNFLCKDCAPKLHTYQDHRALFVFNEATQRLIHEFKYNNGFWVRQFVKGFLRQKEIPPCQVVIPIPLHKRRLRHRGYNQSLLFADLVAVEFAVPIHPNILVRVKETASQTGLKRGDRRENLQDAFRVVKQESVDGKDILLIDDVRTTGATLDEAARTLLRANARSVQTMTIAIVI